MELDILTEKKIDLAKKVAKEEYENYVKSIDAYNPRVKRKWRFVEFDDRLAWALEGTPDKAFVIYWKDSKTIQALRQDHSIIKEWIQ